MAEKKCSCTASVWGGFKLGTGVGLGLLAVSAVPFIGLFVIALPAYLGSLARSTAAETAPLKGPAPLKIVS